ncbi:glycine dehydrogenase (decarboxylating) alpha subunit [Paraperlucidibaca baekdonensis]|uniref:Probable glycine dehydrogenase (decarboxylating) subunit 1 n=1 Tax=Paraperlucidibaca baekdonensis TaxID=748120 RepID=A0A3E0H8G1_9GAMM|nr:aminomethyl-transferring glycine dehydrogenase subunit GcvPA [Paraperlucidibaca baekdonensis]REH39987.1 glycine dehydrogenase (decarboxylating) alpha subunit [Paraperlucidibaca baekdonensis]
MPFIPHTAGDVRRMLDTIGAESLDTLFDEIPQALRCKPLTGVPDGLSEMDVTRMMRERSEQDAGALCFLGAGAYEHHIPAAVWDLASRGEFLTAYTPYQAEASQGTLQVIYEFQSMMAHLTAMDASNASVYDGASGLAEAVLMAIRANKRSKSRRILMPRTVSPMYRAAARAIVEGQDIELVEFDYDHAQGRVDVASLGAFDGEDFAALVIPQPNFFGVLEDVNALTDWAQAQGMLVIAVVNPMALALFTPPGEWGASGVDIVVGEAQPFGIPLSSGGPYCGFMCCKMAHIRQMPGRIIGRTVDLDGKPGYALTLQAREQHIRRAKATSNICTNQGLAMTAATIYLSLLGAEGLERVALASHDNILTLTDDLPIGATKAFESPVFHEQVIRLSKPAEQVLAAMAAQGVLAGVDLSVEYPELGSAIVVCTTETKNAADLARYHAALSAALASE